VLAQLIARLTGPLSRRREGVLSLVCRLQYERAIEEDAWATEKGSLAFCVGLFRASASAEYLCDLLRLRLETVRLAGPVTSVQVEVTAVGPLELRQQALFDSDADQEQPRRLAALVDRLSNRLGRAAVVQTTLLADAQPEYTCVDVPAGVWRLSFAGPVDGHCPPAEPGAGRSGKVSRKKSGKKNLTHVRRYGLLSFAPDERPLELLRQPARIEIVALDPHGAPAQFRFAGRSHKVAYAWGPERIETGWWRTTHAEHNTRKTFVRRDYYRVETASGARFWIFHLLGGPQWFLHGRFE
jgi:protein ImuB